MQPHVPLVFHNLHLSFFGEMIFILVSHIFGCIVATITGGKPSVVDVG